MRNEAQKAARRRYEASEKGKAAKKRHDQNYVESGGREATEARRKAKPLTEARKAARQKWKVNNKPYFAMDRSKRRALCKSLDELSQLVMEESYKLSALRTKKLGFNWQVDHIVPVSKGGTNEFSNLQVVPEVWNKRKSNLHTNLFLPRDISRA